MSDPAPAHVVVVGSGLAGFGVLRELRRLSPEAMLTLVTLEDGHFYSKPALSTALAKEKTVDTLVTTHAAKMAAQLKLDLRAGRAVESIDAAGKVVCTTGGPIGYDALVLALGADPIRLALAGNAAHRPISVNNLEDYRLFRERLAPTARILIMGAGLVGTEFANDLAATGHKPVVVDMLAHPLGRLAPPEVGERIRDALAAEGVSWRLGRKIVALHDQNGATRAELDDGSSIETDIVLSAVGLRPHTQLAAEAGLAVGTGVKVNATGRTSDPFIYAIGDCAEYEQGLAAYITPIMAAARAIAPSALGAPTPIRFPPLSVQVKTTFYPTIILPAPLGVTGSWDMLEADGNGLKYVFRDGAGAIRGYVLTQHKCEERVEMDRALGDKNRERA